MKKMNLLSVFTLLLFQVIAQDFQLKLWPSGAPNKKAMESIN